MLRLLISLLAAFITIDAIAAAAMPPPAAAAITMPSCHFFTFIDAIYAEADAAAITPCLDADVTPTCRCRHCRFH